jgi:hypothetical protein
VQVADAVNSEHTRHNRRYHYWSRKKSCQNRIRSSRPHPVTLLLTSWTSIPHSLESQRDDRSAVEDSQWVVDEGEEVHNSRDSPAWTSCNTICGGVSKRSHRIDCALSHASPDALSQTTAPLSKSTNRVLCLPRPHGDV